MVDAGVLDAFLPEVAWQDVRQQFEGVGTALHEQRKSERFLHPLLRIMLLVVLTRYVLRW